MEVELKNDNQSPAPGTKKEVKYKELKKQDDKEKKENGEKNEQDNKQKEQNNKENVQNGKKNEEDDKEKQVNQESAKCGNMVSNGVHKKCESNANSAQSTENERNSGKAKNASVAQPAGDLPNPADAKKVANPTSDEPPESELQRIRDLVRKTGLTLMPLTADAALISAGTHNANDKQDVDDEPTARDTQGVFADGTVDIANEQPAPRIGHEWDAETALNANSQEQVEKLRNAANEQDVAELGFRATLEWEAEQLQSSNVENEEDLGNLTLHATRAQDSAGIQDENSEECAPEARLARDAPAVGTTKTGDKQPVGRTANAGNEQSAVGAANTGNEQSASGAANLRNEQSASGAAKARNEYPAGGAAIQRNEQSAVRAANTGNEQSASGAANGSNEQLPVEAPNTGKEQSASGAPNERNEQPAGGAPNERNEQPAGGAPDPGSEPTTSGVENLKDGFFREAKSMWTHGLTLLYNFIAPTILPFLYFVVIYFATLSSFDTESWLALGLRMGPGVLLAAYIFMHGRFDLHSFMVLGGQLLIMYADYLKMSDPSESFWTVSIPVVALVIYFQGLLISKLAKLNMIVWSVAAMMALSLLYPSFPAGWQRLVALLLGCMTFAPYWMGFHRYRAQFYWYRCWGYLGVFFLLCSVMNHFLNSQYFVTPYEDYYMVSQALSFSSQLCMALSTFDCDETVLNIIQQEEREIFLSQLPL